MFRRHLMRAGYRSLLTSLLLTLVFAAGAATGIYFYPQLIAEAEADDHDSRDHSSEEPDHDETHEEEEDHVALTEQAYENLGLRLGMIAKGDYWKTLLVPARVVEIPGRSDLSISAPVTGVVEDVRILPGQSITPTEPLFVIRLTDEALVDAQSKLLETLTRKAVVDQEIARLKPLIQTGAVSGTKTRDLEYELKQLLAQQTTLLQALQSHGLPKANIDALLADRVLASTVSVYPPSFVSDEGIISDASPSGFSVEQLMVHPGKSMQRGQSLCTVAYHSKLYLEGTAFEDDLPVLDRIAENAWKITVEVHGEGEPHTNELCLDLLRVDNHIDEETQTVRFFVELPNQVTRTRQAHGRRFEQWRFRPGQRLHLRLPVEQWKDQLMLPADAVVVDGPNAFVFVEHHHDVETLPPNLTSAAVGNSVDPLMHAADDDDHEEHDVFIELEPIPVRLLYRDDKTVVIADDGQVPAGEPVALNNAYKLYLEMKMQAGGGVGHHHHHDH